MLLFSFNPFRAIFIPKFLYLISLCLSLVKFIFLFTVILLFFFRFNLLLFAFVSQNVILFIEFMRFMFTELFMSFSSWEKLSINILLFLL